VILLVVELQGQAPHQCLQPSTGRIKVFRFFFLKILIFPVNRVVSYQWCQLSSARYDGRRQRKQIFDTSDSTHRCASNLMVAFGKRSFMGLLPDDSSQILNVKTYAILCSGD